jgi:hypothetical protein
VQCLLFFIIIIDIAFFHNLNNTYNSTTFTIHGIPADFKTKDQIKTGRGDEDKYLARDYLIALWKSVPENRLQQSTQYSDKMQDIYDAFLELSKVDGKWNIRDSFNDTQKKHNCYPWQKPLHDTEGTAWALEMAAAALQLPYFVEDEELSNSEAHFQKVKDIFQEVSKGKVLLQTHKEAFDAAREKAIFKKEEASKTK